MGSMKKKNLASTSMPMPMPMMTACFVLIVFFFFFFFFVLESNLSIVSKINISNSTRRSISTHQDKKSSELKSSKWDLLPPPPSPPPHGNQISCDRSHRSYDICSINGATVLDPTTATFFLVDPSASSVEKIRPYPRKWENSVMKRIKELTITSGPTSPKCEIQHNDPALVFSAGGYTGNLWHEFNDGFIPLFITVNSILPGQDFILVVNKAHDWWVRKYAELLHTFSKHPIINLDNDTATHCFTSATLGLISHGYMTIEPTLIPNSKTFIHFRGLLDKAYSHGRNHHRLQHNSAATRPQLVLTSRRGSIGRVILNQAEAKRLAEEVGFDVIIFEPTPKTTLHQTYAVINSSHAMIGVHGAALTHSLFLRPGSVFGQVVPLGLEWVADTCFGTSARAMGLEYMEYKINAEESSLIEKYSKDDLVMKDPVAFRGKEWSDVAMNIYLKEQNVKLDLIRFRDYLEKVLKKAKRFMDKEG